MYFSLIDVQANLPETSLFFVCSNGFGEHLFQTFIVTGMYTFALLANSLVCIARTRYAWKLDEMRPRVSHRNSSLYEISKCLFPVFYILPAFYLCHELGGQKIRMNWVKHIFLYKKLHFWSSISNYRLKNSKCGRVKPRSDIP